MSNQFVPCCFFVSKPWGVQLAVPSCPPHKRVWTRFQVSYHCQEQYATFPSLCRIKWRLGFQSSHEAQTHSCSWRQEIRVFESHVVTLSMLCYGSKSEFVMLVSWDWWLDLLTISRRVCSDGSTKVLQTFSRQNGSTCAPDQLRFNRLNCCWLRYVLYSTSRPTLASIWLE